MRDKRNEDKSGDYLGDGGDNEDDDFDDNKSMIVMGSRWDMASRYRWEMTVTDGNDGFCSVKINVDE